MIPYKKYEFIKEINKRLNHLQYSQAKKIKYLNIPCAFDIETSSFYNEYGEKTAIMYIWQFGIFNDLIVYGRTWPEFLELLQVLQDFFRLSENYRLICFIHNLSYEFQFFRFWIKWKNVFALDKYKPVYALSEYGVEFRCSYLESGYSLDDLAKSKLNKYPVKKLKGFLDYDLIRHSKTELTEQELNYCENDIQILLNYVREKIENGGSVTKIQITKTSYVRNFIRHNCFNGIEKQGNFNYIQYKKLMGMLKLNTVDFYNLCKKVFYGGFAHANYFNAEKILANVQSFDKTSDYPAIMAAEKFPMSPFEKIKLKSYKDFNDKLKMYCCMFIVEFKNLQTSENCNFDNYISYNTTKIIKVEKPKINNGRIMSADRIIIAINEIDYKIINMNYDYDGKGQGIVVFDFYISRKGYLPTNFVKSVLELYKQKTELKGITEKEVNYALYKEMLNASYGMLVTDPIQENVIHGIEWKLDHSKTTADYIKDYDENSRRFTYYPWGIYVTSYARLYIWQGIKFLGNSYAYSDTDSLKFILSKNLDERKRQLQYFEIDNMVYVSKLKKACEYHKIDFEKNCIPQNIKGESKILGTWENEGIYKYFKTLGAKRYIYVKELNEKQKKEISEKSIQELIDKYEIPTKNIDKIDKNFIKMYLELTSTISGLSKTLGKAYLINKYKTYKNIFDNFAEDLKVPVEFSGRKTHTYIDTQRHGIVTDYRGIPCEYFEKSAVHLEGAEFTLDLHDYKTLLICAMHEGMEKLLT